MSTNPQSLRDLAAYWQSQGGTQLGVVGDMRHCTGYHLGRDRIYGLCACQPKGTCIPGQGDRDYSVQHPRDKAGLSNAASALDLGALRGSFGELQRFSRWLVAQCAAGASGTSDIREVIYSPDGTTVQRWSGIDNRIHTGPGNGDASHRTHTHISFFRDSEFRDKRPVFARFFGLPPTDTEDDMLAVVTERPYPTPRAWRTRPGSRLIGYDPARPNVLVVDRTWTVASPARASAEVSVEWPGNPNPPVPKGGMFFRVLDGVYAGLLVVASLVDPDPAPAPDCADAVKAAVEADRASARIVWGPV